MKNHTKEEIIEKAINWARGCGEDEKEMGLLIRRLVSFAESLFQETEQETYERLNKETSEYGFENFLFEFSKRFHEERKKIENGH